MPISPPEFAFAAIKACFRDLGTEADVRAWRRAFLSTELVFVRLDLAEVPLFNFNLREQLLNDGLQVGWTSMQRIQMVLREQKKLAVSGKVTAARLAKHFSTVRISAGAESMSATFIDSALSVDSRIFAVNDAKTTLQRIDSTYGVRLLMDNILPVKTLGGGCPLGPPHYGPPAQIG